MTGANVLSTSNRRDLKSVLICKLLWRQKLLCIKFGFSTCHRPDKTTTMKM